MTKEFAHQLKRLGRKLFWPHPLLYYPIGLARWGQTGNVLRQDHVVYISGYPRSANSYALLAFRLANPDVRVRSHRHIPTFVLVSISRNVPGIILLRNPLDAAVSWSIYNNISLCRALQYYGDYYSVLLPFRDRLFIARFEDVIADFGSVMSSFNDRWGTNYACFANTPENRDRCLAQIEDGYREPDGSIREAQVARPSNFRAGIKQKTLAGGVTSRRTKDALRRAQDLYAYFLESSQKIEPKLLPPQKEPAVMHKPNQAVLPVLLRS